jgi:FtsZ-binding cell division protein ZapB
MNWKLPNQLRWRATILDTLTVDELSHLDMRDVADELREAAHEIDRLRAEVEHLRTPRKQWPIEMDSEEGDRANELG